MLVTGGCGFIGSHVVERLLHEGVASVVIVDSMEYGIPEQVPADPRVQLIAKAIEDPALEEDLNALEPIDYVIHLAARKHNQSSHTPELLFTSNIHGTERLLAWAGTSGVKRLVYSSSLYAYGRWAGDAMVETEMPQPTTLYGMTKLAGEHICAWASRTYGLSSVTVRYFFAYGPRQYPGLGYKSVIVKNFERMRRGDPAVIRGDGLQELDYIYVTDIVEGTLRALLSGHKDTVFNICSGVGISVHALTDSMYGVAGATKEFIYEPADETAGSRRVGDGAKARAMLDFVPSVPLEEGLRQTYAWLTTLRP